MQYMTHLDTGWDNFDNTSHEHDWRHLRNRSLLVPSPSLTLQDQGIGICIHWAESLLSPKIGLYVRSFLIDDATIYQLGRRRISCYSPSGVLSLCKPLHLWRKTGAMAAKKYACCVTARLKSYPNLTGILEIWISMTKAGPLLHKQANNRGSVFAHS